MASKKITVIGSFVVGQTLKVPRLPVLGETLPASLFDIGPGGKGNNQAVALKRLGADVSVIVRVGDDLFGNMLFELSQKEGIPSNFFYRSSEKSTGVALGFINEHGEPTVGVYLGANDLLSVEDIEKAKEEIQSSELVLAQLEIPDEAVLHAFRLAQESGVKTLLNPAPARILPKEILERTDILIPNQGESLILLGKEPSTQNIQKDRKHLEDTAEKLLDLGPKLVIITLGSEGALAVHRGEFRPEKKQSKKEHSEESLHISSISVNSIDTIGAGDSFTAGFSWAWVEGLGLPDALYRACLSGAYTTTKIGVIDGLPYRKTIENYIHTGTF